MLKNLAFIFDMSWACNTSCVENAALSNRFEYLGRWNDDMNVGTLRRQLLSKRRTACRERGDSDSMNIEWMDEL